MKKPHPATVVASLALVAAVTPPAYAALAKNSVGSAQIQTSAVKNAELAPSAVTGGKIKNGAIGVKDLGPLARPATILTGSWDNRVGFVSPLNTTTGLDMGSLSTSGGGALQVTKPSRLIITGMVYLRVGGAAAKEPTCRIQVNGADAPGPSTRSTTVNSESAQNAVSVSLDVTPGPVDVGMTCKGDAVAEAGNVHVDVIAIPH